MKIGILSRNSQLYSTRRLVEAGRARGHQVQVIDPLRCYMNIATSQPGSSSKTQSSAGIELQHELMRNVLLGGEVRYINDDFREIDRVDNRAQLDLSAEYLLNRYVSVAAEYRYEQRWSDADNQDYGRNLITVGLKTRF